MAADQNVWNKRPEECNYSFVQNRNCEFSRAMKRHIRRTLIACSAIARCTRWVVAAAAISNGWKTA